MLDGDGLVSAHERKLWTLHQEIIFRWGVYTMFQWRRMHVGEMKDEHICWFVPREAPECYEIIKWLEYELGKEEREPSEGWPGCQVHINVMECSCVEPYVDRDTSEEMAAKFAQMFKERIKKLKEKKENGDKDQKETG